MNALNRVLTALSLAALPMVGMADNMQFTGTLLAPPACTISDKGGRMDVPFGNMAINRIDGEQYRRLIPYQIDCPGARTNTLWRMRLTLKGNHTLFDTAALQSSVPDLGIRVKFGDAYLKPEQTQLVLINPSALPLLEAVPVKLKDSELPGIAFTASALLLAEFY